MNNTNASVAKVRPTWSAFNFTEVVREWTANDNVDPASWAAQMADVAASWADRPAFDAQRRAVQAAVAAARQANRPRAVRA